ncbi:uncharacterized protein [Littorina saxatilis]|uniref:uncharacterized protein isoform X2 n=1 Tax=Littorina saxatilis TaxID=31220 RepID=UPI0038B558DD
MNRTTSLYLVLGLLLLMFFGTISGAGPTISLVNCPTDFVPTPDTFNCTCAAENVDSSTFSILWKDPAGSTVTQSHGNEKTLLLHFSAVRSSFNTKQYQCELLHDYGSHKLTYSPKIAEPPSKPYLRNCPEVPSEKNASCTCMTSTLGLPPALLTWEDSKGLTVKLTESETLVTLPFTAVPDSYSEGDYRCVVTQILTGVNMFVSYKPPLIVKPNNPRVFGVLDSYRENQNVEVKCSVWGGVPGVINVDLHCTNHEDQPDQIDADGKVTSALGFMAKFSDDNTECVCQGSSRLTSSHESTFPLRVKMPAPDGDDSTTTIIVPVVVAVIGTVGSVIAAIIAVTRCKKGKCK